MNGVLVVDKPRGGTSFDVVRQVRRAAGVRKVGHGGTLDPLASGVLPICLGEATKLAQFLLDADKEYEVTLCLGVETDTYDADGAVTARHAAGDIDEATVRAALAPFVGPIAQRPPVYSALKRAGRALYEYARAGETVEIAERAVTVHQLDLLSFVGPEAVTLRVRCSKGTYVRSLVFDLGRALGPGAHVTALRRTRSGPFSLEEARSLPDTLLALEQRDPALKLVSLSQALSHLPRCSAGADAARDLTHGKRVPWSALKASDEQPEISWRRFQVLGPGGALLAVAERRPDDTLRTLRVFNHG
ncbi:MAG TPA: tRNA pseudouridine(55) synthase TruB [Polyangia bacterium]|jgi:tRNA pseudouridine55 synthase|nr:tRNA pseudouridine(55) synthase TruB [Polyangia bacterium]